MKGTRIQIRNLTIYNYVLKDNDGNFVSNINALRSYSLKLNYSATFEKQYNLTSGNVILIFFLSINGEVSGVINSSQIYLQVGCPPEDIVSDNLGYDISNISTCQKIITIKSTNPLDMCAC